MSKQRPLSFTFLLALLVALYTSAPFYAHATPVKDEGLLATASLLQPGETLLICTSKGMKWLTADEIIALTESGHTPKAFACELCAINAHSTNFALTSAPYIIPAVLAHTEGGAFPLPAIQASQQYIYNYNNRAPPLSI